MTETQLQLQERVYAVQRRIEQAARAANRSAEQIHLVAATKMNDAARVRTAIQLGIKIAGENRVQELLDKYAENAYQGAALHFIGNLQTNKVKNLIGKVSLIQSVGSVRLGQAIAKESEKQGLKQDILLEVNIGQENAKGGLLPQELEPAIEALCKLSGIHIRGLMAIPPIAYQAGENLSYFHKMQQHFIDISEKKYDNVSMDYLSMGMSSDFEDAITCGSNMVRIGSSIFGQRAYKR